MRERHTETITHRQIIKVREVCQCGKMEILEIPFEEWEYLEKTRKIQLVGSAMFNAHITKSHLPFLHGYLAQSNQSWMDYRVKYMHKLPVFCDICKKVILVEIIQLPQITYLTDLWNTSLFIQR